MNFKKQHLAIPLLCFSLFGCVQKTENNVTENTLKDAFKDRFLIGAAVNTGLVSGTDAEGARIATEQFNSVVAENCMKSMYIQPEEGTFNFDDADKFVEFGEKNNMVIIGHTLVWHSQTPAWFFVDENGNDVSREVLIERIKKHITTLVSRYKGRIYGWDVVNEAILDDGSWRKNKFYEIIGEDYVRLAFEFAQAADPNAELYYNDYSMAHAGRRNGTVAMIKSLQENGIKVAGIGMQGHFTMDFPVLEEFEKSLLAFSALGVKVMITELDMTVLPNKPGNIGANIADTLAYQRELNPYTEGLPDSIATAWNNRMGDFFKLFLKHHDKIDRVTVWGISDASSWKNDWPIKGRTDYPLLFDRNYHPKPVVQEIIDMARKK
jgi:endo-1,4-beta-xylanase